MRKFLISLFLVLAISFFALFLGRNIIAKKAISFGISSLTGLKAEIEDVDLDIFHAAISIKGLKVFNPAGFSDALMLDLPTAYASCDWQSFFKNRIHLKRLKLELKEFCVITPKSGKPNVTSLSVFRAKKTGKAPELQIDFFALKLGKIVYKDYNAGDPPPRTRELALNLDVQVSHITKPEQLLNFILTQSFRKRDISGLVDGLIPVP
jgi:hypothetical protein